MRLFVTTMSLAFAVVAAQTAQADFVIDAFDSAASTGFADTTRTGVTTIGAALGSVGGGTLAVSTVDAGAGAAWTLNFPTNTTGIKDVGVLGYSHFLALNGMNVTGDWTLTLVATGPGNSNLPGTASYAIAAGTTDTVLDLTALDHVGNLNGISSFAFTLTKDAAGLGQFVIDSMSAVPEPSSIALLGLTGIGGLIAVRRRRKKLETA